MKTDRNLSTRNSIVCCLLLFSCSVLIPTSASAQPVSAEDLNTTWSFYGKGLSKVERGMLYMREDPGSLGVMMVSPQAYPANVTVRYEIMPMTAASVCVFVLSASDKGEGAQVTLPVGYDGSMGHWIQNTENYFFAFHNASHNRPPFIRRFPERTAIGEYSQNIMSSGKFHTIEVGRKNDRVWLEINGQRIIEGTDANPLGPGHLAFRIRGLSEEPASCLIKNVVIDIQEE